MKLRTAFQCLTVLVLLSLCQSTAHSQLEDMVFPGDAWDIVAPETMAIDSVKLEAAITKLPNADKTMILRNGRVIWQGDDVDSSHEVFSITKSFASTGLGLLVDDGVVALDTKAAELNPALAEHYPDVTLRHLVTQTSGLHGSILNPPTPRFTPPGSQYHYNEIGANNALSHSISVASGTSLQELIVSRIAEPIGMDLDQLEFDRASLRSGETTTSFNSAHSGLAISASNLARYGHLYLNGGDWNGEQLLSSEWIQEATQVQVNDIPNHESSGGNYVGNFGYGWWRYSPDRFNAFGFSNNRLMVNPNEGFVVVSLGFAPLPSQFGITDTLIRSLEDAEFSYVWDGQGDGDWHGENNDASMMSRWLVRDEPQAAVPHRKALISTNHVTMKDDVDLRSLELSGDASLTVEGVLKTSVETSVGENNSMLLDGTLETFNITIHGSLSTSAQGSLQVGGDFDVFGGRVLLNGDAMSFEELLLRDGSEFAQHVPLQLESLSVHDSQLLVDAPLKTQFLDIRESQVLIRDHGEPLLIESNRVRISDSTMTFVIEDSSWNAPITMLDERAKLSASGSEIILEIDPSFDASALEGATLDFFDYGGRGASEFSDVRIPSRIEADLTDLYETGEITITSVLALPLTPGDFNGDDVVDVEDIDQLSARIQAGSMDGYYDADSDGTVTKSDLRYLVEELLGTQLGDVDLNGSVEFADFLVLSENFGGEGDWQHGDLDGNGFIEFADFLALSDNYVEVAPAAVPEPTGRVLVLIVVLSLLLLKRSRFRL